MRPVLVLALLVAGCAAAGHGGDDSPPIGRAARASHGVEPLASPPPDAGNAEDPKAG